MICIDKSLLSNVLFAVGISNLAIQFLHLFISGFDEVAFIIFTEVWNFGIQVNPELLVGLLEMLPYCFNLPTKIPMEVFDEIVPSSDLPYLQQ